MRALRRARELAGVLLIDLPRYQRALSSSGPEWLGLCNRREHLEQAPDGGPGVRCDWVWSSALHAASVVPSLGRRLLHRALRTSPVCLDAAWPACPPQNPRISFIVPHRGMERLPLLGLVLRSLAGQGGVSAECILAEHSPQPCVEAGLPAGVRYVHAPASSGEAFSRARAFNRGAHAARGDVLVFHDGDLLAPAAYGRAVLERFEQGYDVMDLKRFIFYLDEGDSLALASGVDLAALRAPRRVVQNSTGGGSLAVGREGFERVGGYDGTFIGWGGEDVEFWERAQRLRLYPYGHLPFLHLWHPPQPEKTPAKDAGGMRRLAEVTKVPVDERIRRLRERAH